MIDTFKEWVGSIREDVETVKGVVTNEAADSDARKFAATALNYLVTRLDLVPDHEPTIGVIDDAMVLRVCMAIACDYGLDDAVDSDTLVEVARLANEAEKLEEFLGVELHAKLKKYCARLSDDPVRGRTPSYVVGDAAARAGLLGEVDDELLRMPAATFDDPASVERQLLSYLKNKLN